jgi:predicted nucleic acid-binding protein
MNDDTATTDPIVPLYARWKAARTEWLVLSDAHPDGDVLSMQSLSETMEALMREMARTEATTPLGLALQLRAA